MRIIAGEFRGFPLKAPKGNDTRPTGDRVRESVMSVISSARGGFEDAVVLDAFAGSGVLGLESISRGASTACLCDWSGEAIKVISDNVKKLGLDSRRVRIRKIDTLKSLTPYARPPFDVVFLDPPYAYEPDDIAAFVKRFFDAGAFSEDAIVVYEHAVLTNWETDDALEAAGLELVRRKKYGKSSVDIIGLPAGNEK